MPLDTEVSRIVFLANLAERALHDTGPWSINYGSIAVTAHRAVYPDSVVFISQFPEVCWHVAPEPAMLYLSCRDDVLAAKHIVHPGDSGFRIDWSLMVHTHVSP